MSKKHSRALLAGAVITAVLIAVLNHSFAVAAKNKKDGGEQMIESKKEDKDISLPVYAPSSYWIGVRLVPVPEILLPQFGVKEENSSLGVIENVVEKSPADKAGLKRGDVILSFGDKDIRTLEDLVAKVAEVKNKEQKIVIFREGKKTELTLTPEERPKEAFARVEGGTLGSGMQERPALNGMPGMRLGPEIWLGQKNPREMMKEMEEYFRQMQGGEDSEQFVPVPNEEGGIAEGTAKQLQVTTKTDDTGKTKITVRQVIKNGKDTEEKHWEASSFEELPEEIQGQVKGLLGK